MNSMPPSLDTLLKFYHSSYRFVYKANPGNAGDGVIASGTYDFFERNAIEYEPYRNNQNYNANEDILIFGGGGNLIEGLYSEGRDFILEQIPNFHKVIIMPSTIKGYESLFQENKDKLIVFCREKTTFNYIQSLGYMVNDNVYITDDMAFYLDLNKYLSLKKESKEYVNCYRTDSESLTSVYRENNHDISLTWNGDYWDNEFLARNSTRCMVTFLEEFKSVNTDRLHVAILASLLGKEVNFYPNSYYKNKAVYDYSLLNRYPKTFFMAMS
ncbi:polysaccharide pyruvyl transferase family protein [Pluralibacter gergoviae]|uniref:polysaccharide pyruvyl transferase family protein n=1 Tax=Pluralibacter gergoviae TaxID=61647 RepID=UPI0009082173|nr:polysaccharide pyruvyl transferase family protein [Pluralibacter gergoviae]EKW9964752.1 polysaccharide pyruvyl transferase family protein [Pluralibacter gergoviae]ELD4299536.1 polysaccharide pyruvyl transferase family protein [Pluralibacter gergoviae]ELN2738054.1 polysaccharide pyruvyl transferase family protein [Pluralibacter gergoviae]